MKNAKWTFVASAALMLSIFPVCAFAQSNVEGKQPAGDSTDSVTATVKKDKDSASSLLVQPITLQHFRPQDKRGLNVFEPPKDDNIAFTGLRLVWGAAFTQQFQSLSHSNTAAAKIANGVNANQLIGIGAGFNNANANLNLNLQVASGVRVALTTYLSARHHQEAWVKDGYILIDDSPVDVKPLKDLMKVASLRVGHFEVNYGDAHFRRSDNGNAIYNPFVGNYIMDAFTTEIGAEAYLRSHGLIAMAGVTGGEIHGEVTQPENRSPAFLGKAGFDRQLTPDVRVRLTGSVFRQEKAISNTLYGGDRAGSRYYLVLEPATATTTANAWSGNLNPGFKSELTAFMVNPFVKVRGLELFGVAERSKGRAATETANRTWTQYAGDAVYRFGSEERLFAGARYNTASGTLAGISNDVSINRVQLAAGWFVTPVLMLKGEYVTQKYNDFPTTDIRNGGKFSGFVMEGTIAF